MPPTYYSPSGSSSRRRPPRSTRHQISFKLYLVVVILCMAALSWIKMVHGHALSSKISEIGSGVAGYCLDLHQDQLKAGAVVDSWACNDSAAQNWSYNGLDIKQADNFCLSATDGTLVSGTPVTLAACSSDPNQVWLYERGGFENPRSSLCLSLPKGQTNRQLVLDSCSKLAQPSENWNYTGPAPNCKSGTEGQRVACFAAKEWSAWQAGTPSHSQLLKQYTDGTIYEAWCADFVSYVYKEAGYPFRGGEADGWNENNANNIQFMGFTSHDPSTYTPRAGDVAYFDYNGGHVEIVVSGGQHPTFIYGNSATIDPNTGNGQMAANTITHDGPNGHLIYYLSPN